MLAHAFIAAVNIAARLAVEKSLEEVVVDEQQREEEQQEQRWWRLETCLRVSNCHCLTRNCRIKETRGKQL